MVCKIVFCSEFPNIPDNAGKVTRRRRTQAIAKRYTFHGNAIKIIIGLFWLLTVLVLSNLKLLKYKLQKILNKVKCSRNFEFQKRADQNFITQNIHHGNIAFRRKRNC